MSVLRGTALALVLLCGCAERAAPPSQPAADAGGAAKSACPDRSTSVPRFYETASDQEACRLEREREWEASRAERERLAAVYEAQRRQEFGSLLRPQRAEGGCDRGYKLLNGECYRVCTADRDCAPEGVCVCADGGDCTIPYYSAGPGHAPFVHTQHTCFPKGRPVPISGTFEGWTGPRWPGRATWEALKRERKATQQK